MPTQTARKQIVNAESFFGRKRMLSSSLRKVRVTELTVCLPKFCAWVSNGRSRLYGKFIFCLQKSFRNICQLCNMRFLHSGIWRCFEHWTQRDEADIFFRKARNCVHSNAGSCTLRTEWFSNYPFFLTGLLWHRTEKIFYNLATLTPHKYAWY